jgi:hypothetical protein
MGKPKDVNMVETSGAVTPGKVLTEDSRNSRRRILRKATTTASKGSGLVDRAAVADDLAVTRGRFTFRALVTRQSAAQSSVEITAGGPRRSERIRYAASATKASAKRQRAASDIGDDGAGIHIRNQRPGPCEASRDGEI